MATTNEDTILSQYVPGFVANLALAPQQLTTRLLGCVDSDLSYSTPGQMFNADDIQDTDPEDANGRAQATPRKFLGFSRRVGMFKGFQDAALLDNVDKARELEDPSSKTMQAIMAGRWRKVDTHILFCGLGNAMSKADDSGTLTSNALPAGQVVAASDVSYAHDGEVVPSDGHDYGMSVGKLIHANLLLDDSDLEGERYLAISPDEKSDLLRRTPVTSIYYADVKALADGKVSSFLGFTIVTVPKKRFIAAGLQSAAHSTGILRKTMAWIKPAIVYKGRPITEARIAIRHDLSDTPEAFYKTEHDAVRRYDTGVVEIDCYAGPTY